MKIKVRFSHNKKSKVKYATLYSYHFGDNSGTGPVIERGDDAVFEFDVKKGDTIDLATTKFEDEFDIRHKRRGRVLNGISEAKMKKDMAKYKRDIKSGKIQDPFKNRTILDVSKLSKKEAARVKRITKKAKDMAKHGGVS